MVSVLDVIHSLYAIVGISGNLLLLVIILITRSSGLNSYALILANVAIVDIVEIALDAFEVPRAVAYEEEIILYWQGYCKHFGTLVCFRCHLVMFQLIYFSLFLIAFSFWYRYTVLIKSPPAWRTVQQIIVALFIPNVLPVICGWFSRDDRERSQEILREIYPGIDVNSTGHRTMSFADPFAAPTAYNAIFVPFIVYSYIIVVRRKTLHKLASLAENMSVKAKLMHASLIRALTYHAALPSTICIGVLSFYLQLVGFRSPVMDSLLFTLMCIPATSNSLLILYFVLPFRRAYIIGPLSFVGGYYPHGRQQKYLREE